MSLSKPGKRTLAVDVQSISRFGIWLLVADKEFYASYEHFPWFKKATVEQVIDVTQPHPGHLYWPQLDIDHATDSLEYPERFPLVSQQKIKVKPIRATRKRS